VSRAPSGERPDRLLAEIERQPAVMRRTARAIAGQLDGIRAIADRSIDGRLVVTGMGSSFDAGHALVAALGPAGIPVRHLNAAELLHFGLPTLDARSTLVVVSQSGRSVEIVRLLERIGERPVRPFVVGITNGLANPLADGADVALDMVVGEELGPATMTFAASLVVLDAVARALLAGEAAQPEAIAEAVAADTDTAAAAMDRVLARRAAITDHLIEWHDGRPTVVIVSRGAGRAASDMASLTLKEVAAVAAESLIAADFRHGPLELVGEELAVAFIDIEPATDAIDRSFARELDAGPASVITVGRGAADETAGRTIALGPIDGPIAAAVAVVPFQLLARELAIARGREPGRFVHAAKITMTE